MLSRPLLIGLAATGAVVLALVAFLEGGGRGGLTREGAPEPSRSEPTEAELALPPRPEPSAEGSGRTAITGDPAPVRERARASFLAAEVEAPPPIESRRWLTARFVRADGGSTAGAPMKVHAWESRARGVVAQEVRLEQDGSFRIALLPEWTSARLVLDSREHARLDRHVELPDEDGVHDLGTIVLASGGTIAGFVSGLADPRTLGVSLMPRDSSLPAHVPRVSTHTAYLDGSGRFVIEHVAPGKVELTLSHPLIGVLVERELEVVECATTPFEFTYDGPDPAAALFVQVAASRAPLAHEAWLTDERGRTVSPEAIDGRSIVFADLDDVPYTLTLAFEEREPLVWTGLCRGKRIRVGADPPPAGPAATLNGAPVRGVGAEEWQAFQHEIEERGLDTHSAAGRAEIELLLRRLTRQ